jgi:hypothetical protein
MLRYYMSPETQQAVIAESNRMLARRSQTRYSGRGDGAYDSGESSDHAALDAAADSESSEPGDDSAFSRLVADLRAVSSASQSQ